VEAEQRHERGQAFGQNQPQYKIQNRQFSPSTPSPKPRFQGLSQELGISLSSSLVIQPKLMIGASSDKYEQEADDVAAQVVHQLNAWEVERSPTVNSVGRSIGECPRISDLQMKPLPTRGQQEAMDGRENWQMERSQPGAIVKGMYRII
jgi:hypothetical protein